MAKPWHRWPKGLREAVFTRDAYHCRVRIPTRVNGQGKTVPCCKHSQACYRCAEHLDHIIPAPEGPWFDPDNLRASCAPCNRERRRKNVSRSSSKPSRRHVEYW